MIKLFLSTILLLLSVNSQHKETNWKEHWVVTKISHKYKQPFNEVYDVYQAVKESSAKHGVDKSTVLAVIATESAFKRRAKSKYAQGYMQINKTSGKAVGESVTEHVDNGVALLAEYQNRYGELKGLMVYNTGPTGLKRNAKSGSRYAKKVLDNKQLLAGL